jgi:hypothetical protein
VTICAATQTSRITPSVSAMMKKSDGRAGPVVRRLRRDFELMPEG